VTELSERRLLFKATPPVISATKWSCSTLKFSLKSSYAAMSGNHVFNHHNVPWEIFDAPAFLCRNAISKPVKMVAKLLDFITRCKDNRKIYIARDREIVAAFAHTTQDVSVFVVWKVIKRNH
jgi:hypothetical protein